MLICILKAYKYFYIFIENVIEIDLKFTLIYTKIYRTLKQLRKSKILGKHYNFKKASVLSDLPFLVFGKLKACNLQSKKMSII